MFDASDELEEVVEKLATSDVPTDLVRLRKVLDRLDHMWVRSVRDMERSGVWQADGFVSPAAWLRRRCRLSQGTAAAALRLGRTLEQLPATAEAFAAGRISHAHAQVIARGATADRMPEYAASEPSFVLAATHAAPDDVRPLVQRVTDQLDGDGGAAAANHHHDRRYLVASKTTGGVAIDGFLDADAGDVVLDALRTAMRQSRQPDDPRTTRQRRADAFVELCRVGILHHHDGPGRADRPQLSVIVDLEVLEARGGTDLTHTILTLTESGTVLSAATLDRICCDAGVARIITAGRSQPLDVGRSVRTHTSALWRALVARDGGCVADGCDRPPGWCEVHHKIPWAQGGETNLENCELRCWLHHRAVHEGAHSPKYEGTG